MNEKMILAAINLFDSEEKWESFVELVNIVDDDIIERWWKKLQTEIYQQEKVNNTSVDWKISMWKNKDIIGVSWYVNKETDKTFTVSFDSGLLYLQAGQKLDIDKVKKLMENSKFDSLENCFDRIDGNYKTDRINNGIFSWEEGNFHFGSIYDGRFDESLLSWYAGNRTEDFTKQVIAKVRKFQTPEITELFKEINRRCKIS